MSDDDPVSHPKHYATHPSGVEAIDITELLSFNLGNALKYVWRAKHKGREEEDLKKALWYIRREIRLVKISDVFDASDCCLPVYLSVQKVLDEEGEDTLLGDVLAEFLEYGDQYMCLLGRLEGLLEVATGAERWELDNGKS